MRAADLVMAKSGSMAVKCKDVRFEILKICRLLQEQNIFERENDSELLGSLAASITQ